MYIEDDELRELYKTSSLEHIQKLESDLMILEKNPQDISAIEEFLREAHTLKGDSRMLGLNEIEMLVHQLEDCVEGIKGGKGEITPELCDRLYQGIDAVNQLAHQAITGEAVTVNTVGVLSVLMGEAGTSESVTQSERDLFADDSSSEASLFDDDSSSFSANNFSSEASLFDDVAQPPTSLLAQEQATISEMMVTPATNTTTRDYQIDTIRVDPQKLDILATQTSELTVTKLRISQQLSQIEQMLTIWEGWYKNNRDPESILESVANQLTSEQLQPLRAFWNQTHQCLNSLADTANNLKTRASEDITNLNIISDRLESGIQDLRQLPLATVFNIYPRMVRDLGRQLGKEINLIIEGGDTKADKRILEEIKDPLLHLIRNAIDHGIETPSDRLSIGKPKTATLILRGSQIGDSIGIEVIDDGRGLDLEGIKQTAIKRQVCTQAQLAAMTVSDIQGLIFASGFSTRTEITELSGRGVGLDVVRANVEKLKGSIQVSSNPGSGCRFQVRLNTSLATTKVMIVEINQTLYALPLEFIQTMITLSPEDIYEIEGKSTITFEDQMISLGWLAHLLQLPTPEDYTTSHQKCACIIIDVANQRFGVIVDNLIDQQDVVIKPQSKLLKRIPNITGATILGSGEVCMILNPPDLLHSLRNGSWQNVSLPVESSTIKNKLLLVEDSIIIRTQMQRLLKGAGYEVSIAENGLQGWQKVQNQNFDIVLSDVEMPEMNGLEMTTKIRQHRQYDQLPIVLITTLSSPEDKQRGIQAGANAYLTKGDFEQELLFQTLNQLINS
ncbi:CheA signal transduction histidine kinase [Chondrocystis sp. NIES-4102]|nr:CheA signal transduction histidine kinase [Chondrocystis sp. NIES-4102]